jgi:Skp family chaperone for outer membrane proteins
MPTPRTIAALSAPNRGLGLLAVVAIAIATVGLLRPQADASAVARPTPPAVATVDLVSVITQLDEFQAIDKKIKADGEKKKAEIEQLSTEIEGMQEDLKRLDPNSDAYDEIFRQLNMKAGFRELRGTMLIRWQSEDNARVLTELYEKALEAVADVAKRDGWDVVVHTGQKTAVPRNPNIRAEQAMDFVEDWIQSRRVIYSNSAVDISSSVVQHMNNRFHAGG